MDNNDGGPIFYGMSLRDYFASQALIGLISNCSTHFYTVEIVEDAYYLADAMLEVREDSLEREKREKEE